MLGKRGRAGGRRQVGRRRKRRRRVRTGRGYTRRIGFYGRYGYGKELKFHDVDLDDATVAAAGTVTASINLIPQGATEKQRIGRKCTIKSIGWKYNPFLVLQQDAADIGNGDVLRVIMYIDRQCNGAAAAVTDILESADYQSFNNLANVGRFQKLIDKSITINRRVAGTDGASTVTTPEVNMEKTFYKKCNIPVEFNAATGVIAEIRSNNLGVLLISKNGNVGFLSKIRLRFEG